MTGWTKQVTLKTNNMNAFPITIKINEVVMPNAEAKAKAVEILANNLSLQALKILADKSAKQGMSEKVIRFKNML